MNAKTREQLGGRSITVRELCSLEIAPVRVTNVIRNCALEGSELLDLELSQAVARWGEVHAFLMSLRALGKTSSNWVHDAARRWLKDHGGSTNADKGPSSPDRDDVSLRAFCLNDPRVSSRVKSFFRSLHALDDLWGIGVPEAVLNWGRVEDHLKRGKNVGEQSVRELLDVLSDELRRLREASAGLPEKPTENPTLAMAACHPDAAVPSRIRTAFLKGEIPTALANLPLDGALNYWTPLEASLLDLPSIGGKSCREFHHFLQAQYSEGQHRGRTALLATKGNADHFSIAHHLSAITAIRFFLPTVASNFLIGELGQDATARTLLEIGPTDVAENARPLLAQVQIGLLTASKQLSEWLQSDENQAITATAEFAEVLEPWRGGDPIDACCWLTMKYLFHENERAMLDELARLAAGSGLSQSPSLISFCTLNKNDIAAQEEIIQSPAFSMWKQALLASKETDGTSHCNAVDIANLLLANLNVRDRNVIQYRADATGPNSRTLQATGEAHGVTRERVRQIEVKWRATSLISALTSFLERRLRNDTGVLINQADGFADADELISAFPDAGKHHRLIAHALGTPLNKLIEELAVFGPFGCGLKDQIETDNRAAILWTERLLAETPHAFGLARRLSLPTEVLTCAEIGTTPAVLNNQLSVIETDAGPWVCTGALNASNRVRATVDNAFLAAKDWFLTDQSLYLHAHATADKLSPKSRWRKLVGSCKRGDIRRLWRLGWIDLRVLDEMGFSQPTSPIPMAQSLAIGKVDEGLGVANNRRRLYEMLHEMRAARGPDIINSWGKVSPTKKAGSANYLLDDPYFVIVHPGHFGCLDQNSNYSFDDAAPNPLNNRRELSHYFRFRNAGFSPTSFAAWTADQRREWAEVAEREVSHSIKGAVIDQLERDNETASKSQNIWEPCDDVLAASLNEDCRQQLHAAFPKPTHILDLLLFGLRAGFVNYYVVNCIVGRQWYSHKSVSWLAWLVASGAVSAPNHWQGRFEMRPRGLEILRELLREIERDPKLSWKTSASTRSLCREVGTAVLSAALPEWMPSNEQDSLAEVARLSATPGKTPKLASYRKTRSHSLRVLPSRESDTAASDYLDPFLSELLDD